MKKISFMREWGHAACIACILILVCILPVSAGLVHAEGPGWTLIAGEEAILDPATGEPYLNYADYIRAESPLLWKYMSDSYRSEAAGKPAPRYNRTLSVSLQPGTEQLKAEAEIAGSLITEAQYYGRVWPGLFNAAPQWVRELWAQQTHTWSETGSAPAAGQTGTAAFNLSGFRSAWTSDSGKISGFTIPSRSGLLPATFTAPSPVIHSAAALWNTTLPAGRTGGIKPAATTAVPSGWKQVTLLSQGIKGSNGQLLL
jgi:hypothetical protein